MKKFTLLSFLLIISIRGFGLTTTVSATNSSFSFAPSAITIATSDSVHFVLGSIHNAVEVSQATWNANSSTALPGGFSVPFGGNMVISGLSAGTHYYVCQAHVGSGMKGTITVLVSGVIEITAGENTLKVFPNPASDHINITYHLSEPAQIDIKIINVLGSTVSSLLSQLQLPGDYTNTFDLNRNTLPAGIYVVELQAGNKRTLQKLIVR